MGLNRQEKAAVVEEVGALVATSQSIVVAEYRGLDVDAITRLRKQARSQGVQPVSYTHLTLPTTERV